MNSSRWTTTRIELSNTITKTLTTKLANSVLAQSEEEETTKRQATKIAVLQTQKIQALEAKLNDQLATIATSSGNSIPGQIPATIDTSTSGGGGGSTTSTVIKEVMMQMFTQFTKNFQQG